MLLLSTGSAPRGQRVQRFNVLWIMDEALGSQTRIRFKGFIHVTVFGFYEMNEMNRFASPNERTNNFAVMGYVDANRRNFVSRAGKGV
jgi:hypothetical protein